MGSFGLDESRSRGTLAGKPVQLIFTGGAPAPAWHGMMKQTTSFMQEGLRYFGMTPVGSFFEGKCTKGRGKFGLVVHERPETIERVKKMAIDFGMIVQRYKKTGQPPLSENIKGKIMKIGERILKKITRA